jgi:rhodanese-related sulfurtransferase
VFPPPVPSVGPAEVADGAAILDVREQDEWQAGHIPGALHIPLGQLTARVGELPPGEVVVVCRSGGRSGQAVAWLNESGFETVNLDGGMQSWSAAGRPMTSASGQPPFVR